MSDEPRLNTIEWDMMDRNRFLSLTVVNSLFLRSVLYPLVLVKTRLQVQKQNTVYTGAYDAFKKIIRTEGFCGLYKGFWINSIQVFSGISYIATYEKSRDLVSNYTSISDSKTKAFLSGGISSFVSQTLIIPFDVVSQHIMMALNSRRQSTKLPPAGLQSSFFKPLSLNPEEVKRYGIAATITKQLYREGGFRSFYRGYFASLICFVPSSACWWMLYQYFNEFLDSLSFSKSTPHMLIHCTSGVLSGGTVSIMTNPLDLLRANIQVHRPSSYASAVKYLWKEDRWRVFNKGLSARLTQSCLSSALIVIGYETMKRFSVNEKYRSQVVWLGRLKSG
ncbi:Solute carrier family 25 member 44 [Fragariocoptes setiger]|uniref:Solute carrier family 25 member 44 n=1 Tax=Fragariocoptes setiger TaxID=1670756 RepID=A0ABQ7S808_9ACAR|nr:Solute carrier family 25 member 44 [Fragariocoptes setiger]